MIGVEHMVNATMFTLADEFYELNKFVDDFRLENRATILQLVSFDFEKIFSFSGLKYK